MVFRMRNKVRIHPKTSSVAANKQAENSAGKITSSSIDIACEEFIRSLCESLHTEKVLKFTKDQVQEVKEVFALFDKNGDGTILRKNLKYVFRMLGKRPTEEQFDEINNTDKETVDFIEFLQVMDKISFEYDDALKEMFNIFDIDETGVIASDKFSGVIATMGGVQMSAEEVNEFITEIDVDGDGQINLKDFINMLKGTV